MNAKEKAKELVNKFHGHTWNGEDNLDNFNAKECALICCDEVLGYMGADRGTAFWNEVKQEIEKL
jgi:hypothetical protein